MGKARVKLAALVVVVMSVFGGAVSSDRVEIAQAHTWYCDHGTLYTSPGVQRERFGGHYANGDHHVTTQRYTPFEGGFWYIVDTHRRICH